MTFRLRANARLRCPVRIAGATLLIGGLAVGGSASASASVRDAAAAGTNCASLPASFNYTEYSPGTVNETNGDSDGPTAYGGTSTLGSFSMSYTAASGAVGFVAGGPVSGGGTTSVHTGDGYADNNVTGVSFHAGTLHQTTAAGLPVNFPQVATQDASLSAQLAALQTTSGDTTSTGGTTLTLAAVGSPSDNQYVWDLPAGTLANITTVDIAGVPSNGTIVVNVPDTGTVAPKVTSVSIDGVASNGSSAAAAPQASSTIFNFSGATNLSLTGTWEGTLFAPNASTTFAYGHVFGTVVGSSLTGSHESTYGPLDTNACFDLGPAVQAPQGRPIILAGGALVVLAGGTLLLVRRQRRRSASI